MRIPKTSAVAMIATLMALTMLPAVAQSVLNGDCEAGTSGAGTNPNRLTNWVWAQSAGNASNWTIGATDLDSHSGAKCGFAHIVNGGSAPYRYSTYTQTVTGLVANATYDVKGWMRVWTVSTGAFAKLGARTTGDATYTYSAENATDNWVECTVQAAASAAGEIDVQAYLNNGACGYTFAGGRLPPAMFDDVSVELVGGEIPEPGSMIAVLSGLIGLAGLAMRRRA